MWGAVPSCLMWCIWKERNRRTFERKELSLLNLKLIFLKTLYEWCFKSYTFSMNCFMEFVDTLLVSQ